MHSFSKRASEQEGPALDARVTGVKATLQRCTCVLAHLRSRIAAPSDLLVQAETAPDSEVEFEQLLLSAPNSSFVWVKYLAFLVSLGEMERARQLAERALATIHYRCGPAAAVCAAHWLLVLSAASHRAVVVGSVQPAAAQLLSCGRWGPLAARTRHVCVARSDPQLVCLLQLRLLIAARSRRSSTSGWPG